MVLTDGMKKRNNDVINKPAEQAINRPNEPTYVRAIPPRNIDKGIKP